MNSKYTLLYCIIFFICFGVNAKELKGFGNPKIGKIVQISRVQILTESKENLIYPKYKIDLQLIGNNKILDLKFQTNYVFGQDLNLISSRIISLNSKDLNILNDKKHCSITIGLESVEKENVKNELSEGDLNEERISNGFIYLKYK